MCPSRVYLFLIIMAMLCMCHGQANSCRYRRWEVSACIDQGYVDFTMLFRPSYKRQFCREMAPAARCASHHLGQCPNIPIFQGQKLQTLNTFLSAYQRLCSAPSCRERQGPSMGCDRNEFSSSLTNCHNPLAMAYTESQMCQPMQEVALCVEGQVRRHRSCGWMTSCLSDQLLLAARYFRVLRVLRYNCPLLRDIGGQQAGGQEQVAL
ncbi:hypothetical protein ACOMHN_018222 [Nucella lapillus]